MVPSSMCSLRAAYILQPRPIYKNNLLVWGQRIRFHGAVVVWVDGLQPRCGWLQVVGSKPSLEAKFRMLHSGCKYGSHDFIMLCPDRFHSDRRASHWRNAILATQPTNQLLRINLALTPQTRPIPQEQCDYALSNCRGLIPCLVVVCSDLCPAFRVPQRALRQSELKEHLCHLVLVHRALQRPS